MVSARVSHAREHRLLVVAFGSLPNAFTRRRRTGEDEDVRGKLPRTTGWQSVLRRVSRGVKEDAFRARYPVVSKPSLLVLVAGVVDPGHKF